MEIKREDHPWGARLLIHPLAGMEISAEIGHPKPKKNPEVTIWFSGVPPTKPLKPTEVVIWAQGLAAIREAAKKVADSFKKK